MKMKSKYIHMVRDGITPRKIEACQDSGQISRLAKAHGWASEDVKTFANAADTKWGRGCDS